MAEFVLDSGTRELRSPAGPCPLSPKALDCLVALVEQRPRVVSRAELHDRLWPKSFVAGTSLRRVITELRAALGDDERQPRFVRTVRGFGYAYCGPADEERGPAAAREPAACRLEWGQREIPLHEGENILGRTDDAVVWIDSPRVSRRHARIVVAEGTARVEDLGSKNGTKVSGRPLSRPVTLASGDQIDLGGVVMTFRAFRATGSTETRRSRH